MTNGGADGPAPESVAGRYRRVMETLSAETVDERADTLEQAHRVLREALGEGGDGGR